MTAMTATKGGATNVTPSELRRVVFASSLGTVFEWYDFYLYATLAPFFAALFFPPGNDTAALLSAFATYAAGFLVRPFGAIIFGRIGDIIGRKYTFLITIMIMGLATVAVGFLPTYAAVGWAAPVGLMLLRLAQGLALGGEYGGAATYVAEHTTADHRGYATSWIQTTATLGFFLSLVVIYLCRTNMDAATFSSWGWRIPFIVSLLLLVISVYIRLKLNESPLFQQMQSEGKASKHPLYDSFFRYPNNKYVLLALLGATAGQGVVWYTGQFYALFFLTGPLKLGYETAYMIISLTLLVGTPLFVLFGWLSDKMGRKPIIMLGCLLAVLTYFPLFKMLTAAINPGLVEFQQKATIQVKADPATCNFRVFAGPWSKYTDCDLAKNHLASLGISYEAIDAAPGEAEAITISGKVIPIKDFKANKLADVVTGAIMDAGYGAIKKSEKEVDKKDAAGNVVKDAAGNPVKDKVVEYKVAADPARVDFWKAVLIISIMVVYVTMVYGPIAAFLVELFPTRIRYTSMSLPYHIGNGWFGGLLPLLATAIVATSGSIYQGLWYPIIVAAITLVIGTLLLHDTKGRELEHE